MLSLMIRKLPNQWLRPLLLVLALNGADAPAAFAEEVLTVGVYGIPKALGNPYSSTSISEMYTWSAIFDTLTEVDGEAKVLPALATEWRSVDELTWRFKLRSGVKFSNGEAFNADAVIGVIDYLTSPDSAAESMARELRALRGAKAIGELEVEIYTHEPTLILPAMLAAMRIVAPGAWRKLGPEGFARAPVGTGAFKVERWSAAKVSMLANTDAWRPPLVDRLEILEILDPAARVQGVQSGGLDIAIALTGDDIAVLEDSGAVAYVGPGSGVVGMSFVTVKDTPIADSRVRQALNYAVDKAPIVSVLLGGHTRIAGQPAPHYAHGYNPDVRPFEYDPDKAKSLLKAAGYEDGFSFVAEVVLGGSTSATPIYSYMAQQLAKIGVDMEVRSIPIAQLISKAVGGGFEGAAFGMEFDFKPSLDVMRGVPMHSCQRAVPWHCDKEIMPTIEAAQREFDRERRLALLQQIMQRYHDNPSMLFLFESVHFDGLSPRVRNYNPSNRIINYHGIRLE
jgi:peptide/nickel transport system substrate-binding protein